MYQQHIRNKEAREKLLNGINIVADIVAETLGPFGKNVCINNTITNDGVTIAKSIQLSDPYEDAGAYLIKDAADKTNKKVGDGTTTTTIIARELANRFSKLSETVDSNIIRDEAKRCCDSIVSKLKERAIPCETIEELTVIATNSVENKEIGKIIAEAVIETGKDGVINTAESKNSDTYKEIFKGIKIERGYVNQYMCNLPEKGLIDYSNIPIIVTDREINSMNEIVGVLTLLIEKGITTVAIVCNTMSNEVVEDILNTTSIKVVAIKGPVGTLRIGGTEDIAIMTGAKFYSSETNEPINGECWGTAHRLTSNRNESFIFRDKNVNLDTRIEALKSEIEISTSDYEKTKLEERIAKLSGGIGIIYIGGATDIERRYLKDKIDDAIHATKAAYRSGMILGGGEGLFRTTVDTLGDGKLEIEISRSVFAPVWQLYKNKTGKNISLDDYILKERSINSEIYDPVEVEMEAIKNAISVASILITTNTLIVDVLEDKDKSYEV